LETLLIIEPLTVDSISESICEGDSLFIQGEYQYSERTYRDTVETVNECNRIEITSLTIVPLNHHFAKISVALI
jgi:hypothetical protein